NETPLDTIRQVKFEAFKTSYYVTTPIYYVNSSPHIGHLYSSVIADTACRWQQLYGKHENYKLATGTDEHGTKIQQAAAQHNTPLETYCANISDKYRELAKVFSVNCTDFIRTTDAAHEQAVQHFWRAIRDNGHVYSSKYAGWYCVSDETFLTDSQLKEAPAARTGEMIKVSAESGHPVEWTEEQNYMFGLSKLADQVKQWILKDDTIRPKKFQKILLDMMDEGVPDVSISRPTARVHWGVKVPEDDTQTVYVWLDALVNYLTATGYPHPEYTRHWPADLHVIGKDILKFHGIYWPAFLMAADVEPPRSILCHSHWTVDGEKMSKSKGNVVCPIDRSTTYTPDGFRYFLLREGVAHSDGNYSETKALRILNSELADTLGNLLSRCCGVALNPEQVFPALEPEALRIISALDVTQRLMASVAQLPELAEKHYTEHNFYKVVDATIATLHCANLFFETLKPWELKKSTERRRELNAVLHVALETLRVCGIVLQPIVPNIAANLLNRINIESGARRWAHVTKLSWRDASVQSRQLASDSGVLFKRIVVDAEIPPAKRTKVKGNKEKKPKVTTEINEAKLVKEM
ncbi:methionine--tRNA ligase, mitochondrial-like, partial [Atheta coriaria]|uniref:methionine--tRNA ligase, mitochondrial-like n=1 Tax=Dalotia coriaria TaxID=877792 RepID=UPI0031F40DCB